MNPAKFSIGDIVEVQMTFEATRMKKEEQFRMYLVLRSLALIDNSFSKVQFDQNVQQTSKTNMYPRQQRLPI